jgi:predicted Zn-ribbon and HTH transcriptional regulator
MKFTTHDVQNSLPTHIKLLDHQGNYLRLKCTLHGSILTPTRQSAMRGYPGCRECVNDKNRLKLQEKIEKQNLPFKIESYTTIRLCTVRCLEADHVVRLAAGRLPKKCPACSPPKQKAPIKARHLKPVNHLRQARSSTPAKTWQAELARRQAEREASHVESLVNQLASCKQAKILGMPYKTKPKRNRKPVYRVHAECRYCGYCWKPRVYSLIAGSKCKRCRVRWAKKKAYQLGSRTVMVQGSEGIVLDYLVQRLKIKPSDIDVDTPPVIPFLWKERPRRYFPDIYVKSKNTLVEVKSDFTLGLKAWYKREANPFEKTQAKAKAVVGAGYSFALIVVLKTGTRKLPPEWVNWSREQVRDFLR